MQAVVLAGGEGRRLRPFTWVIPKPLVPVDDMPILEILLRQLARHGFRDFAPAVTGIHAPEARDRVDHLSAVRGPVVHPLGARQQPRIGLELAIGRERHPKSVEVAACGSRGDSGVHDGILNGSGSA